MTNKEASNVLRLFANLIEINGLPQERIMTFRKAYEQAITELESNKIPNGKWINHYSEDLQKMGFRQCSKCKAGCQIYEYGTRKSDLSWIDGQQYTLKKICNFCPNCGAKMKGGAE